MRNGTTELMYVPTDRLILSPESFLTFIKFLSAASVTGGVHAPDESTTALWPNWHARMGLVNVQVYESTLKYLDGNEAGWSDLICLRLWDVSQLNPKQQKMKPYVGMNADTNSGLVSDGVRVTT